MRIIAAIDIIEGKCVRLRRGDYNSKTVYNEDPVEVAKEIEGNGIRYLHLVDLDGAKNKRVINYRILEKIAAETKLTIDFGGGIRSHEDAKIAFNSGAWQITGGSTAVNHPSLFLEWIQNYGNERVILGADAKDKKIMTGGWTEESGEDVTDFISGYADRGIRYAICTDVDKDGMLSGPSVELYREILSSVSINLIASGGVASLKDIDDLRTAGCEGTIIGKAFYEGKIKLKDLGDLC